LAETEPDSDTLHTECLVQPVRQLRIHSSRTTVCMYAPNLCISVINAITGARTHREAWGREKVYYPQCNILYMYVALNDSNRTQSGGLPERHKAHLSWSPNDGRRKSKGEESTEWEERWKEGKGGERREKTIIDRGEGQHIGIQLAGGVKDGNPQGGPWVKLRYGSVDTLTVLDSD